MSKPTPSSGRLYAYVAEFETTTALYHAAEKVREAGYRRWDVHTPFPVHGMDHAMGLGKSWLSALVLVGGTSGFLLALFLQFFTQVSLYPTVVHGKPTNLFTVPAFFPVTFELTILFSGFTILFGMLAFILLPQWHHPLFNSKLFRKFSDDGFLLVIEARDPLFRGEETRQFIEGLGALAVEEVDS